ncbi:SDR family NAD(P)-dependent oxidoreductase [Novosphingobium sp. TH158]|uniref:SDR family NAD(P)-dependent oxidoreductase n=1 Tax=Novosphingobium sp. TH158 TaxID=2067455 RepID=UPI000C797C2D|nr:SDR family oxidoreductase [Novosphingobium sp. TH158]PLK27496.1 short-chain dehydrogenase [Novosphingobium sp. TH158]
MELPDVTDLPVSEIVSLKGRTAVVTGSARGLGKAIARRLSQAGASVVVCDIDEAGAQETAQGLEGPASAIRMDAANVAEIEAVADHAVARFGSLDIWVNNAGVASHVPAFDLAIEEWDKVQNINLRGTFVGAREAARRMIAAGKGGVIVNIASLAGLRGISSGQAAYVSSKHGVVGLTRELSIEFAPHGIRVMGIAPGVCLTENTMFLKEAGAEIFKHTGIPGIAGSPLGRHGVADDVARAVLFCASDMSLFMTGSTLPVDGGVIA